MTTTYHPERPQRTHGRLSLRFEDIAQDGRLLLETVPASAGILWPHIQPTAARWIAQGVVPILSRLTSEAGDGPFAVDAPLEVSGTFWLTRAVDESSRADRLCLDTEIELWGQRGRTRLADPTHAGTRALAGRLWLEHVFTRPFAEGAERRVEQLSDESGTYVPSRTRRWHPPERTLAAPPGLTPLEPDFAVDEASVELGVMHTDSNQHVNSLFFPRAFEEAVVRRLAGLGLSHTMLGRQLEIAFRKPSFAGERLRVTLRLYRSQEGLVACGAFLGPDSAAIDRARVFVRLSLRAPAPA